MLKLARPCFTLESEGLLPEILKRLLADLVRAEVTELADGVFPDSLRVRLG